MVKTHQLIEEFKKKYPKTVAWRLKQNSKIIDIHLNPDEEIKYAFACQKSASSFDMFSTYAVAITNKRMLIGQKRLLFGYLYLTITPELYNDLSISRGIIWGMVNIDTVKEEISFSNIDTAALPEIETQITTLMLSAKKEKKQVL